MICIFIFHLFIYPSTHLSIYTAIENPLLSHSSSLILFKFYLFILCYLSCICFISYLIHLWLIRPHLPPSPSAATRLLSGSGVAALGFTEPRYCAVLSEDAPLAAAVTTVTAIHKQGQWLSSASAAAGGGGEGRGDSGQGFRHGEAPSYEKLGGSCFDFLHNICCYVFLHIRDIIFDRFDRYILNILIYKVFIYKVFAATGPWLSKRQMILNIQSINHSCKGWKRRSYITWYMVISFTHLHLSKEWFIWMQQTISSKRHMIYMFIYNCLCV